VLKLEWKLRDPDASASVPSFSTFGAFTAAWMWKITSTSPPSSLT
jgi:hypothetical protein